MSITTWDIETTVKQRFKRKATPFGNINHVVLHGWKNGGQPDGTVQHRYFGRAKPGPGWLGEVLRLDNNGGFGTRLLAGFNIKFDLLHALQDPTNLDIWMRYVSGGGQVWDCQLAEYLLNGLGQKEHMLSLDEVAPRYGGNLKVDEVKVLWNAGVETTDIDPDLLKRYLCGGPDETGQFQKGDVENTEAIALAQIKRAREAGQLNSIMLNMGSLLCTIEMERNGMFVDVALGLKLAEELKVQIDAMKLELEKYMPVGMPFKFSWTSRFHKSALIFGGGVNWDAHEYDIDGDSAPYKTHREGAIYKHEYEARQRAGLEVPKLLYSQMDELHYLLEDGGTMECKRWEELELDTNNAPVRAANKGGKNAGEPKTKKVKVDNPDKPKGRGVKAQFRFPGFTAPEKRWESSDAGVYSTAAEVIEELGNRNVPFLKTLASLQAMMKDLSTYYIVTDEETGDSKGMLALVDPHGIIHHKLNHTSTVTARFSSSDPNLQNVPKGKKSQVKRVFVSRFGPDGKIIQSDFTALEVYIQAILTKCKQLIEDLKAGLDMHCVRVSQKENIPYDEALRLCKGYTAEDGTEVAAVKEWDSKRTDAKVFSFQRAYGAGAKKISDSTGIPLADVEAMIVAENVRYPEIDEFYSDITEIIKANRKPGGFPVPHPEVRGVMCNLGTSWYRTPDGKLYSYQEQPSPEYLVKKGVFSSFSPTEIKNYIVQGGGGEWAKAAMWLAVRAFYARRNFEHSALLVNQVHDALYADAAGKVAEEAAALLHACMVEASTFMEWFFRWEVPVPVPSDTTWGSSMMEEKAIPGIKMRIDAFRKELRDVYMAGYKPTFESSEKQQ